MLEARRRVASVARAEDVGDIAVAQLIQVPEDQASREVMVKCDVRVRGCMTQAAD